MAKKELVQFDLTLAKEASAPIIEIEGQWLRLHTASLLSIREQK